MSSAIRPIEGDGVGLYRYRDIFYTGTKLQPDILTIFLKRNLNDGQTPLMIKKSMLPIATVFGYSPILSLFTGIALDGEHIVTIPLNHPFFNRVLPETGAVRDSAQLYANFSHLCDEILRRAHERGQIEPIDQLFQRVFQGIESRNAESMNTTSSTSVSGAA